MNTVLIYSGGMDSTVLLWRLRSQGHQVKALGINYGQRHGKELTIGRELCREAGIPFDVADLSGLRDLLGGSSQTDPTIPVPDGHYAAESMKATVVPNRNMIMLSVAIGHAVSLKYDAVAYAAHGGDHTIYPDCRPEFAALIAETAAICDWHPVQLLRPFIDKTKADIAAMGARLDAPLARTWSCYKGLDVQCGVCGTCVERREAFTNAGIPDLTEYAR